MSKAVANVLDIPMKISTEVARLSSEYTWIAWIRTGTCLIAAGFLIYKVLQQVAEAEAARQRIFFGAYDIPLVIIATGLGAVLGATVQHRLNIKKLGSDTVDVPAWLSLAMPVAISVVGILALLAVILGK